MTLVTDFGTVYTTRSGVYRSEVGSVPLAPAEERVLRRLLKSGPGPVGAAKAAAARLIALGLVAERVPEKRNAAKRIELTDAGRREAERLPPERITAEILYREIVSVREKLDAVLLALESAPAASIARNADGKQTQPATHDEGAFERELRSALHTLDRRGRHGGLVPIPEVRRALAQLGLSRRAFDDALLDCERSFVVDLKIAHDSRQLADAAEGVSDAARGLLYYAVLR